MVDARITGGRRLSLKERGSVRNTKDFVVTTNCDILSSGTVAFELSGQQKKTPEKKEICTVTGPTGIAFAANQKAHEKRSADSLQRVPACRAGQYASFFIKQRKCSHPAFPRCSQLPI